MLRIIGLDVGERRIGVAVSDPMGWTAQGLTTIFSKGWNADIEQIIDIAASYETGRILVGLPRSMDGAEGAQAKTIRSFGQRLTDAGLEVLYWDERLSTSGAQRVLIDGGVRRDKRRLVIDKLAATWILQSFLDAGGWPERPPDGDEISHRTNVWRKKTRRPEDESMSENGNMERTDLVELVDEDGNATEFEHLMTVEHNGELYVLLAAVEPDDELGEDEVLILKIQEDENGEEAYVSLEDDALIEAVFEKYLSIVESEDGEDEQ